MPGAPEKGGADININLAVTFVRMSQAMSPFLISSYVLSLSQDPLIEKFRVNGVPFESPTVPVLLQILSGVSNASQLLPSGSVYGLERNKTVEITIPGISVAGGPVSSSHFSTFNHNLYSI